MHYSSDPEIVRCIFHAAKKRKECVGAEHEKEEKPTMENVTG